MAAYFQILGPDGTAVSFNALDNMFCQTLEQPWSSEKYLCGWYDWIGFLMATGHSIPEIVDKTAEAYADHPWRYLLTAMCHILLERGYSANSWYGR
jgi:hypothetical protein